MTLNGVMAVTLRYFTEFGKPALQKTIYGGIYARVYCIFSARTMSSQRKFTFAISSPDEFLVPTAYTHWPQWPHSAEWGSKKFARSARELIPTGSFKMLPLLLNVVHWYFSRSKSW